MSLAEPLRRYANISAKDLRLNQRGTLVNGELKTGATKSVAPQVSPPASPATNTTPQPEGIVRRTYHSLRSKEPVHLLTMLVRATTLARSTTNRYLSPI